MNNIIRFWNLNRKKIIIIGLAVVFFIIIIQILNQMAKAKKNNADDTKTTNIIIEEQLPTKSIISGKTVSKETTKNNKNTIDEFIENCNNANIEAAYNMITDECKNILFPNIETFKANYYDVIFTEKRIYDIDNWISSNDLNTYRIDYINDVMATGKVKEEIDFQDYITIDNKQNGKISINSFIAYKQINKEAENNKIKMNVIGKQVFKEFELYQIEVENKTDKTILLDTQNIPNTILLKTNDTEYGAYLGELSSKELIIYGNQKITYSIRFNRTYNSLTNMKEIYFTDIIEDYDLYMQDTNNYKERIDLVIEL